MLGVETQSDEYGASWEVVSSNIELGLVTEDLVKHLYEAATLEYAAEVIRWWFLAQDDVMNSEEDVRYEIRNGTFKEVWIYSQD